MQDQPTKIQLLDAVRAFLLKDLSPAIEDRGLRFRVLIAANLLNVVGSELGAEDAHFDAEIRRLAELMPDAVDLNDAKLVTSASRLDAIRTLNETLVERIRAGAFEGDAAGELWAHAKATLVEKLSVVNPRFDPQAEIP